MADIWFISDTHFFHENILKFTDKEGAVTRDFSDVTEMNERMVENWNARVKTQDKVYHLGDVAVGVRRQAEFTGLMNRLNGHLRLMIGNHDHIEQPAYERFERIELWTGGKFKHHGFVASHIPLRLDQFRSGEVNVHGHTHQNLIEGPYINVCVEHTGYAPVHLDEIITRIKAL
jgi:calcineurin-like phosphoesterase family protein